MAKTTKDKWNPDFLATSPIFFALQPMAASLTAIRDSWPGLKDYQNVLEQLPTPINSLSDKKIQFVEQAAKAEYWQDDYEPRIFLRGEVQTRLENWHDFFQVLMWASFPKTKTMLNAKHYSAIKQRIENNPNSKQRSALENALTQFDECGAIVVSSEEKLLQLVRNFQWQELFWQNRSRIVDHLRCFVFGHAVYEKALNPYVGLTTHSILFHVAEDFFHWPLTRQIAHLDDVSAQAFFDNLYPTPKHFNPFPVLGMPGWDHDNQNESYYHNSEYFRPGRNG